MVNKTVAWIEDDADEIAVVIKPLRNAGFEFKYYHNYSEVLEHLDEIRRCDLILLDLIIPPGNEIVSGDPQVETELYLGKVLLKRFRQELNINIPLIVLSVEAETDVIGNEEKGRLNVVTLSKPVRPSRLKAVVYELLGLAEG